MIIYLSLLLLWIFKLVSWLFKLFISSLLSCWFEEEAVDDYRWFFMLKFCGWLHKVIKGSRNEFSLSWRILSNKFYLFLFFRVPFMLFLIFKLFWMLFLILLILLSLEFTWKFSHILLTNKSKHDFCWSIIFPLSLNGIAIDSYDNYLVLSPKRVLK